jgi:hypothetical protein
MPHHVSLSELLEAQPPSTPEREEDLAWLAGFWDGEGCVRVAKTNTTAHYPVFTMSQAGTEGRQLCERVDRITGLGGKVDGPFGRRPPNTDVYMFRANGYPRVAAMTIMCWPWLSQTKRDQATRALTAFRGHASRRRQREDVTLEHFTQCISARERPITRREDLAWLAGFWDGEGCCSSLNTRNTHHYPVFSLSQAGPENEALCRRVARIAGGPACVSGPYVQRNHWNPQWKVRISGREQVQAMVAACWPWLSQTKRDQATRVLTDYLSNHTPRLQRTSCPKCGSPWVEPNIVYVPAHKGWRCRVCRRRNPEASLPGAWIQYTADVGPKSLCGPAR